MIRSLVITAGPAWRDDDGLSETGPANLADADARPAAEPRIAIDLLSSKHDRQVVEGARAVWKRCGRQALDLGVLLPTRGLVLAEEALPHPGEAWERGRAVSTVDVATVTLVRESVAAVVESYDLALYVISGPALVALGLPLPIPDRVQQIALTDEESLPLVPVKVNLHAVVADGPVAARRWHVKAGHVRGFLFRRLCRQVEHHGPAVLEWVRLQPQELEQLFYKRTRWRPQLPLW